MAANANALALRNQFIEGVNQTIIDIGRYQDDPIFESGPDDANGSHGRRR
jgi:hypothetical protein